MKEADIICTNPPFSLYRKYFDHLIEHKKKFLILGNFNVATYRNIWPHIQKGNVWLGAQKKVGATFRVHKDYPIYSSAGYEKDGKKYLTVSTAIWLTNLMHPKRENEKIDLTRRWSHDKALYPKYDNYDAIDVKFVSDIPDGYEKEMGVPVSFLMKHNPEQFDLLGADYETPKTHPINGFTDRFYVNGKRKFARLLIRHKRRLTACA